MKIKITLILVSFLLTITTTFSNTHKLFFENDIFTVIKNSIENNKEHLVSSSIADQTLAATEDKEVSAVVTLSNWVLNEVTFADGGIATGSFDYDETNNASNNWSISVSGGNTANFPAITYTPDNSIFYYSTTTSFSISLEGTDRVLSMSTTSTLENSNGTIAIDLSDPGNNMESLDSSNSRYIASGTFTTDIINPVLTVTNSTVNSDAGVCGATVSNFGASATDASGTQTITFDILEGTIFATGTTQVTATATDASSNQVSATFNVVVTDAELPTITLNGAATINVITGTSFTDPGATAADNCSARVTVSGTVDTYLAGIYTLTYRALDDSQNESTTTVSRTVIVNYFPEAASDNANVTEGTQNNVISVMTNDSFGQDGPGTISITTPPTSGAATVSGITILYTPIANVSSDTLEYTVEDANGDQAIATVHITINRLPSGVADIATVDEDSSNNIITVLDNDEVDLDGLGAVNIGMTSTEEGTLSVNINNEVVYTPAAQFVGEDTFTYTITDGNGDTSSEIIVTIDVIVALPRPIDDAYVINQNTSNHLFDVLGNDSFGADGPEGFTITTTTTNGALALNNAGTTDPTDDVLFYTPTATYNGPDSFTYTLEDSNGDTATASVTITVRPIVPVPVDDIATVDKNSSNTMISILANDDFGGNGPHTGHPLTLSTVSDQGATISIQDNGTPNNFKDDVIFYTPFPNFTGQDIIPYRITDADGEATAATLTVTVVEGDNGDFTPTAVADIATVFAGSQDNVIFVLANDISGIDGYIDNGLTMLNGTLTSISLKEGVVSIDNKGTASTLDDALNYTPKAGFTGIDILNYTVTDASGDSSTTTITITVSVLTDVPTAVDDIAIVDQDVSVSVAVLDNDSFGTDGPATLNSLTVTGISAEAGTTAVVNNEVVYTPATNFFGTDTFVYTITDAVDADTSTATVTVNVNAVIDTPTAVDDIASVDQGMSVSVAVLNNDSFGTDGPATSGSLTVIGVSVESGTIAVVNNEVVYTPASNFFGTDSFMYTIKDDSTDTSTATVTVTVIAASLSVPTAAFDFVSVYSGSSQNRIAVLDNDNFGSNGASSTGLTMPNGTASGISVQGAVISIDDNNTNNTLDDVILYTPPINFIGVDIFDYTITDATGDVATATVTVTAIAASLSVLTATFDFVSANTGSSQNRIDVLDNDNFGSNGANNNGLSLLNGATSGTSVRGAAIRVDDNDTLETIDDVILYTPPVNFIGVDIFDYTIKDATGDVATATVTITVSEAINTPTAVDDTAEVDQDTFISVAVLDNDRFGTDDPATSGSLTVTGVSAESGTTAVVNNEVVYTPATSFVGIDSFVYTIKDGTADTSTATVTVTVIAASALSVPTAIFDFVSANTGSSQNRIDVLDNDTFGLNGANNNGLTMTNGTTSSTSVQGAAISVNRNGTLDTLDDVILYTPPVNFIGVDIFDYNITDATGDVATATVTITVSIVADAPIANEDAVTLGQNSSETIIDVTNNDTYGTDGQHATQPLDLLLNGNITTTSEHGGAISIGDSNTPNDMTDDVILYTPPTDYNGIDTFTYTITDGNEDTSTATVTVTLTSPKNAVLEVDKQENRTLENEFSTYPNPSNGYVKNTVFSTINTKATLLIFDMTGKVIYNSPIQINKGANEFEFNLNVKPGVLFIKIISPEVNFGTSKVIFK